MENFKQQWSLEMALQVLQNETIESATWGEAVKWLFLFGPHYIKQLLQEASNVATSQCFPNLKSQYFTNDGQPCYLIKELAIALGISEEEAIQQMKKLESGQDAKHLFNCSETSKIQ